MKKIITLTSLGIGMILGLSLPFASLAAFHETQSPSGSKLQSPVTFSVTADNFSDLNFGPGVNSWKLRIFAVAPPPVSHQTLCMTSSTLSATVSSPPISESFPSQNYDLVLVGYYSPTCTSYATSSIVSGVITIFDGSRFSADTVGYAIAKWWPLFLGTVILVGLVIFRKRTTHVPSSN
ncbi:MAG: hypothetical protein ABSF47_02360 [Minisyncoccia bacterium]